MYRGISKGLTVETGKTTKANIQLQYFSTNLTSPLNDSIYNTDKITFKWDPIPGAVSYHVVVYSLFEKYVPTNSYTYPGPDEAAGSQQSTASEGPIKIYFFPDTGQTSTYSQNNDIKREDGDIENPVKQPTYTLMDEEGGDCSGIIPYAWNVEAIDEFGQWGVAATGSFKKECAMVRDNVTGLIWEVKTVDDSIQDTKHKYTWAGAQAYVDQLNAVNFGSSALKNKWRLPTIKELATIINSKERYPAISSLHFPNMKENYYWSATEFAANSGLDAWCVDFTRGEIYTQVKEAASLDMEPPKPRVYALAVSGGPPVDYDFEVDIEYGTIKDPYNEIMWMQASGSQQKLSWEDALIFCENLKLYSDGSDHWWVTRFTSNGLFKIYLGGEWKQQDLPSGAYPVPNYDNWRLPNRNELMSIVDYKRFNPAVNTDFFPEIQPSYYWTSTTVSDDDYTGNAWVVNMKNGSMEGLDKSDEEGKCYVLPMRDYPVQ